MNQMECKRQYNILLIKYILCIKTYRVKKKLTLGTSLLHKAMALGIWEFF